MSHAQPNNSKFHAVCDGHDRPIMLLLSENGIFMPSTVVALKMARALDTSVEEILWLDGSDG